MENLLFNGNSLLASVTKAGTSDSRSLAMFGWKLQSAEHVYSLWLKGPPQRDPYDDNRRSDTLRNGQLFESESHWIWIYARISW